MHVLVTGGAGFIGTASVAVLVSAGHDVTVLDSLRADVHGGRPPRLPASVRRVVGDVRDADLLPDVLRGVDRVVHLAAKVGLGVDIDDIADYVSTNDLGTAELLRAGTRHLVLASSMVVYGEGCRRGCHPDAGRRRRQRVGQSDPAPAARAAASRKATASDGPSRTSMLPMNGGAVPSTS